MAQYLVFSVSLTEYTTVFLKFLTATKNKPNEVNTQSFCTQSEMGITDSMEPHPQACF